MEPGFDFDFKFKPMDDHIIGVDQLDLSGDEGETGDLENLFVENFAPGEPVVVGDPVLENMFKEGVSVNGALSEPVGKEEVERRINLLHQRKIAKTSASATPRHP
ncbi:hypothetical protein FRX31_026958 [Thalictrum thalictroides]|uniref:Uncharacterized protein n=1 Tax=Thalictrum thalictroides TaxID=46969 RepID=A0A7J6VEF0_THATH|nr:hypothetical protein FRX31_026958 [Thalictrum thalictroides]